MEWRSDPIKPKTASDIKPATDAISETITQPITATEAITQPITATEAITQPVSFVKKANDLSSDEISNAAKINKRAMIETSLVSTLFGSTVGYILYYTGAVVAFLFNLLILFIIFSICVIIYKAIQRSLDLSHMVVGGVGKTMQSAVDGAVIPGFKIGPIKIPKIKLLGFLQKPTDDVIIADSKIPYKAYEVIIEMIVSFFENLMK